MNHLDFELAVGNIDIREYNERIAQRDTHLNGLPNESCSTGFEEEASTEVYKATHPDCE